MDFLTYFILNIHGNGHNPSTYIQRLLKKLFSRGKMHVAVTNDPDENKAYGPT